MDPVAILLLICVIVAVMAGLIAIFWDEMVEAPKRRKKEREEADYVAWKLKRGIKD